MKKHRKETMNSVHFIKLGEDRYLIKVSEFYPNNCCEEEETVVREKDLDMLLTFKDEELRTQEQDADHRAHNIYVYDDNYISELGYFTDSFTDKVEAELFIEQVLEWYGYGTEYIECAKYRFIHKLSIRQTAAMINKPRETTNRIINIVKPLLYKELKYSM